METLSRYAAGSNSPCCSAFPYFSSSSCSSVVFCHVVPLTFLLVLPLLLLLLLHCPHFVPLIFGALDPRDQRFEIESLKRLLLELCHSFVTNPRCGNHPERPCSECLTECVLIVLQSGGEVHAAHPVCFQAKYLKRVWNLSRLMLYKYAALHTPTNALRIGARAQTADPAFDYAKCLIVLYTCNEYSEVFHQLRK